MYIMFGCTSANSFKHVIDNSKKEQLYDFGERRNEKMKFLILVRDEDLIDRGWIFKRSLKRSLMRKKKKLPGTLEVLSFDDIDTESMKQYVIENQPSPYEMYIKLIPQDIYILSNNYAFRYLLAKVNELKTIFIMLGARKINWEIKNARGETSNIGSSLGLKIGQIELNEGVVLQDDKTTVNYESKEMTFGYCKSMLDLNRKSFHNDKLFYFLPKEHDWQQLIINRLERKLLFDKIVYKYTDCVSFNLELTSKFQSLGVNIGYNTSDFQSLEISYIIEYYPLDIPPLEKVESKTTSSSHSNTDPQQPSNVQDYIEVEHEKRANVCKEIISRKKTTPNMRSQTPPTRERSKTSPKMRSQTPPPRERRLSSPKMRSQTPPPRERKMSSPKMRSQTPPREKKQRKHKKK